MNLKEKQEKMKKAAIDVVTNGISIQEAMTKYNICYASVYNAIKKHKLPYKYTAGRTIFFNEDFFHNIDNESKAYWFGFIFADGSIIKTSTQMSQHNRLSICLGIKDIEHLRKFCSAIDYPLNKIKTQTSPCSFNQTITSSCYVRCNSIKMAQDLIHHGCIPNKTYSDTVPKNISDNLIHHFIRGYFDGDGCITYYSKGNRPSFELTSPYSIVNWIDSILTKKCDLKPTKLKYKSNSYTLHHSGYDNVTKIYDYLYSDANIYLDRKYDKFQLLFLK